MIKKILLLIASIASVWFLRALITQYDSQILPDRLQDFVTLSLSIFVEAFPFLVLGSLLAGIVNTYIPAHIFQKILPANEFLRRGILSLLGFLLPVCECGNVPLSRSLMMQGLKPSQAITFLLAAPVINPITIWSTWAAFSYDSSIVVSRIIATLLIANIIGYIISLKKNEQDFLTDNFIESCKTGGEQSSLKGSLGLGKLSNTFTQEAFIMIKMLAFGALIAGAVQTFIPREVLVDVGSNVVLSILAMLLLAFVISICANIDAFFALSFAGTFTAGSLVSFLVFGPMIDIKMLVLLKTTFKNNLLIVVSILALLMSALAGLVVSYAF